jgi:hypothetical protein
MTLPPEARGTRRQRREGHRVMQTRPMFWKLACAAAALAFVIGTAAAQSPLMPSISLGNAKPKLTPEEQAKQDELDKAYKSATNKIPDQKSTDPWATVRPSPSTPPLKKKPQ